MIDLVARVTAALPGYDVGGQLGRGGFGVVLSGRHRRLGRPVAIKVLSEEADQLDGPDRFTIEAQLAASLDHPHVVRVFDYVEANGLYLIIMEQLPGGTLRDRSRAGLSRPGACAAGLAIAEALGCAHDRGILHRDVKPGNVLFSDADVPKVTDFGIAKIIEGTASTASAVVGTWSYMAPEQWEGGRLSAATDVYALGAVLFEIMTGSPLFGRKLPPAALARHHLSVIPEMPSDLPAPLAGVLSRSLAKEVGDRYATARAFAIDLALAARTSFGPGWLTGAGPIIQLAGPVQEAASGRTTRPDDGNGGEDGDRTRVTPRPEPTAPHPVAPPSDQVDANVITVVDPTLLSTMKIRGRLSRLWSGGAPFGLREVAFESDRIELAGRAYDSSVTLWGIADPRAPYLANRYHDPSEPATALTYLTEDPVLAVGSAYGSVTLIQTDGLRAPQPIGVFQAHDGEVRRLRAMDRYRLVSGGDDGTVCLWDISTPHKANLLSVLEHQTSPICCIAFSKQKSLLAAGTEDGSVLAWDVHDPTHVEFLHRFNVNNAGQGARSLAFSPGGTHLAVASGSSVWLGRPDESRPTAVIREHSDWVNSVCFRPYGSILATGSDDGTVAIWDTGRPRTPELRARLTEHRDQVTSVAFSGDGDLLATASADATVGLWQLNR